MPKQNNSLQNYNTTKLASEIAEVTAFFHQQKDIQLVILFGSLATGKVRQKSDIDIAIEKKQPLSAEEKIELISQLALITGRAVDLVDLSTVGEPILGQILKHGKRLIGTDTVFAEVVLKHLYAQADFVPYIKRTLTERRQQWLAN